MANKYPKIHEPIYFARFQKEVVLNTGCSWYRKITTEYNYIHTP